MRRFLKREGVLLLLAVLAAAQLLVLGLRLTGRAPWVFVANGAGVILAEGHGSGIAELTG